SLLVLQKIREFDPTILTKSSLMLGLGETEQEVIKTMRDLRLIGVSILTMGQYLQPSSSHLPVMRYITPESFDWFAQVAKQMGFSYVASGPLVRSSYKAGEFFLQRLS
ncbi:MAG: hypothetical protein QN716_12410, partial [Nitrososphaeraceae archaeon]|nr:hypothetical protein [Nitrososphaeraceae archaeon]